MMKTHAFHFFLRDAIILVFMFLFLVICDEKDAQFHHTIYDSNFKLELQYSKKEEAIEIVLQIV